MNVFGSHCNRPTHRSRLPIRPVLELVGLWPYRDRRPAGFSFSMKQRLALVIALVNDPELCERFPFIKGGRLADENEYFTEA